MTAPIAFGQLHVAPIIHAFLGTYPEVSVRLVLADSVIDLVHAHVDVAVRIGRLPDSALAARRVGEVRWVLCASPAYLQRRGTPHSPGDLADHDCIALEGLERSRVWRFAKGASKVDVTIRPRFSVNTADAVIAGAAAGLGIAYVMSYQAAGGLRDGTLLPIMTAWAPPPFPVQLVHAAQQHQPLKLRVFAEFVAPRLQEKLRLIAGQFGKAGSAEQG